MATFMCAPTTAEFPLVSGSVRQKAGRITAAGIAKEVTFDAVLGPINNKIDDAYRAKYRGSPYLDSMISNRARAATVKVLPRKTAKTPRKNTRMRRVLSTIALSTALRRR
jgi:Uncharacterized protein conserved in bacteria (DUF2255)